MKKLDKNKKYYLGNLSDEQLSILIDWLKENDNHWCEERINLLKIHKKLNFYIASWIIWHEKEDYVCATELFEHEIDWNGEDWNEPTSIDQDIKNLIEKGKQQGLKIIVTFEEL